MSSEPLEVLQVVTLVGTGGEFGGPTTVAVGLTEEFDRRGHRASVQALHLGQRPRSDQGLVRTVPAHRLVPGTGYLGMFNLRLPWALWRATGTADVVHVHAGRDLVSLTALAVATLRRVPVVAQTHGMVLNRGRSWRITPFDAVFVPLLRRAAAVLYLTPDEAGTLRHLLGPRASLRPVANGLTLPARQSLRPHGASPRVVFAARLHPVKQVLVFAEAALRLLAAGLDADFVVFGADQGDLPALLEAVRDPRAKGRLTYGGALGHAAILEAIAGADIFVLPSTADWMPMAMLEAMAAAVPCICTRACGLAPTLEANDAGVVLQDGNPEAVADAIRELLADPGLRERLGQAGRRLVEADYSVVKVAEDLLDLYRGLGVGKQSVR